MESFPDETAYDAVARRGSGARPEPPGEDRDPRRGHARPVPRRPRPDDRRHGAADDRHRAQRQRLYTWVVTIYLLTSTISVPFYGKLSDLYGRKPLLMIGIVMFLIGSALSGLSQDMWQLILFRGIQGLGAGALFPISLAVIGDLFTPAERGKYQGLFGAVFGIAFIVGPLIGGFLTDNVSWHWIFYVNLPIGVVALFVIWRLLPTIKHAGAAAQLRLPRRRRLHDRDRRRCSIGLTNKARPARRPVAYDRLRSAG